MRLRVTAFFLSGEHVLCHLRVNMFKGPFVRGRKVAGGVAFAIKSLKAREKVVGVCVLIYFFEV